MSEFNQCRRLEGFELSFIPTKSECCAEETKVCECCKSPAVYALTIGKCAHRLCAKCLTSVRKVLTDQGDDTYKGEANIRWQTLKAWRRYFHEKVSTKSFYDKFPSELLVETVQDLGCEILDESGVATVPEPTTGSGSMTYRLGHDGKIVGNSVLVVNWFDDTVHGVRGKVELNAYIS